MNCKYCIQFKKRNHQINIVLKEIEDMKLLNAVKIFINSKKIFIV